jgi:hypothetical protein
MRIPDVRKQLSQAADDLRTGARKPDEIARVLDYLVTELWRKKGRRKVGKAIRTPLTPELKKEIRVYAAKHKDQDLQEIANRFNVNPGRVSEILSGPRK